MTESKMSLFVKAWHRENHALCAVEDPFAKRLLGDEYDEILQNVSRDRNILYPELCLPEFRVPADRQTAAVIERILSPRLLARSAFFDRAMFTEHKLGCRQFVILTAGMSTFALRCHEEDSVWELDSGELLREKEEMLRRAGVEPKAVPVACEPLGDAWTEALLRAGFQPERKSCWCLPGVADRMRRDELRSLFRAMADLMAEGSAVCMDGSFGGHLTDRPFPAGFTEVLNDCGLRVCEEKAAWALNDEFFGECNALSDFPLKVPSGYHCLLAVRKAR